VDKDSVATGLRCVEKCDQRYVVSLRLSPSVKEFHKLTSICLKLQRMLTVKCPVLWFTV